MEAEFRNEPFVEYKGHLIVHSGGTPRPRLNDGFSVHRPRNESGGYATAFTGVPTGTQYGTESEALTQAHIRAKAWIDQNDQVKS